MHATPGCDTHQCHFHATSSWRLAALSPWYPSWLRESLPGATVARHCGGHLLGVNTQPESDTHVRFGSTSHLAEGAVRGRRGAGDLASRPAWRWWGWCWNPGFRLQSRSSHSAGNASRDPTSGPWPTWLADLEPTGKTDASMRGQSTRDHTRAAHVQLATGLPSPRLPAGLSVTAEHLPTGDCESVPLLASLRQLPSPLAGALLLPHGHGAVSAALASRQLSQCPGPEAGPARPGGSRGTF